MLEGTYKEKDLRELYRIDDKYWKTGNVDILDARKGSRMMAGLYIKGMEIPKAPVLFCIHPDGKVFADLEGGWRKYQAVPIPPHGDLIDRGALSRSLDELCERICQYSKAQRKVMCSSCPLGDAFIVVEDDAPAIIEAEEGK